MLSFQPGRGQNWTITSSVLALISSFCCVKYLMPRKNLVVFSLIPGNLTDAISARQPRSLGQRRTKDIWDYFSPTSLRDKFSYFSNCSSFQGTGISWNVLVIDCEVGDQSNLMHLSLKTVCRLRLSDCMMCNYAQGFQHCDTHRPMPPLRCCLRPPSPSPSRDDLAKTSLLPSPQRCLLTQHCLPHTLSPLLLILSLSLSED